MTYRHIRLDRGDAIATITMDRPERRNALSYEHIEELIDALTTTAASDARVVVLAANGPVFCAGHDYGDMVERDLDGFRALFARCAEMMTLVQAIPQPVVASVQGHVLGGGCELTLMCDLTIAADDAKFGEPEVRFSHLGPLMVMPWFIGLKRARELLLFGDMIDAKTALEFGMVNRIVPAADLRVETMKYAKRLSLIAPEALRWGKRVINRGAEIAGFRAAVESGVDSFVSLYATQTEVGSEFGRRVQADGLKAALEWRRAQFQT